MEAINVLSLCDGMSCGQIALKELGIPVNKYYASEIDKNAIKVIQENFPDTIQLGDVTLITPVDLVKLPKIDLVLFGFPCRSMTKTTAGRDKYNNGLKGISSLFFDCNNILQWIVTYNNPNVKFMVENVDTDKSKEEDIETISSILGVEPILINSASFSAQERLRLYWTNLEFEPIPENCDLVIRDILDDESTVDECYYYNLPFEYIPNKRMCGLIGLKGHDILKRVYHPDYKSPTLTACRGGTHKRKSLLMAEQEN